MCESADKINVCLRISATVYKDLMLMILKKHKKIFGHIGENIEKAIKAWIKNQRENEN